MEFSNNQSTDHQPGEQTEEAGIPIEMVTCGIRSDAMSAGIPVYGYKFRPVMQG